MFKPSKRVAVFVVTAGLAISASSFTVLAKNKEGEVYDESNVGISYAVDRYVAASADVEKEVFDSNSDLGTKKVTNRVIFKYPQFEGKALATAEGEVNIREKATTDSELIGHIPYGEVCEVKSQGAEWTSIKYNDIEGYVYNEYLVFGDEAGKWAEANLTKCAVIKVKTAYIKEKADAKSKCIKVANEGESYTVISSGNDWTEISLDDGKGFVINSDIEVSFKLGSAVEKQEEVTTEEVTTEEESTEETTETTEETTEETVEETEEPEEEVTEEEKDDIEDEASDESEEEDEDEAEESEEEDEEEAEEETESQSYEEPSGNSGSSTKSDLVNYALQFAGSLPYVYGGASLTDGADCSGFTMAIYEQFGYSLPHGATSQSYCGTEISVSDAEPGDLLFYPDDEGIGHVGIYIGGGQIVHASTPATGVKISPYDYEYPCKAVRIMK